MDKIKQTFNMPDNTVIDVIIERASDGTYACYPESDNIEGAGYGDSVQKAIDDFIIGYEEIKEIKEE